MLNVRIASSAGSVISAKWMLRLRKMKTVVGVRNRKIGKIEPFEIEIYFCENVHHMSRYSSYHKISVWSERALL